MWVGWAVSVWAARYDPALYFYMTPLVQETVAVAIASFDLIVLWLWIGVWEYRGNLRAWMRSAFGGFEYSPEMRVCPRCGFKPSPQRSHAQELMDRAGA